MVSLPADVKPIYGNPNLDTDVRLQKERGEIASPDQRDAERITAIAGGITTGVDNYYGVRKKQTDIEYREAATEAFDINNERNELRLKQDLALQDERIEAEKLQLAHRAASARMGANVSRTNSAAYALFDSDNEVAKLSLFTDPKFAAFRRENKKAVEDFAKELMANGSKGTQDILQAEYFDPKAKTAKMEASEVTLKELDKREQGLKDDYINSIGLGHIPQERLMKAKPVMSKAGVPTLQFYDNGTTLYDSLPTTMSEEARTAISAQAVSLNKKGLDIINTRAKIQGDINGEDPAQFKPIEVKLESEYQERAKKQKLQSLAEGPEPEYDAGPGLGLGDKLYATAGKFGLGGVRGRVANEAQKQAEARKRTGERLVAGADIKTRAKQKLAKMQAKDTQIRDEVRRQKDIGTSDEAIIQLLVEVGIDKVAAQQLVEEG